MKYLGILLAAVLITLACEDHPLRPQHKYGDVVEIRSGFYAGQKGRVVSWRICGRTMPDNTTKAAICYNIQQDTEVGGVTVATQTFTDVAEDEL